MLLQRYPNHGRDPSQRLAPGPGRADPSETAEQRWKFATLLQAGGINSTELELLLLEELFGGMR